METGQDEFRGGNISDESAFAMYYGASDSRVSCRDINLDGRVELTWA